MAEDYPPNLYDREIKARKEGGGGGVEWRKLKDYCATHLIETGEWRIRRQ